MSGAATRGAAAGGAVAGGAAAGGAVAGGVAVTRGAVAGGVAAGGAVAGGAATRGAAAGAAGGAAATRGTAGAAGGVAVTRGAAGGAVTGAAAGAAAAFRLQEVVLPDGFAVSAAVGGAGEPLVYLPGFPDVFSVAAEPMAFHRALCAAGRVHAVAPPGALGDADAGFASIRTVDDLVFRYRWWAEASGLGRVRLVGHSWGAWLALEFACWFPELVSDLVLLCPLGLDLPERQMPDIFRLSQPSGGFGRADLRRLLFAGESAPAALALFPDTPLAPEEEMRRIRVLRFMAVIGWQPAFFYDRDLPRRARRFQGRSLVVSGGRDAFAGPAYGEALSRLLGAEHAVLDDCGHAAVVESPEALAARVLAFLGAAGAAPAHGGDPTPPHSGASGRDA